MKYLFPYIGGPLSSEQILFLCFFVWQTSLLIKSYPKSCAERRKKILYKVAVRQLSQQGANCLLGPKKKEQKKTFTDKRPCAAPLIKKKRQRSRNCFR